MKQINIGVIGAGHIAAKVSRTLKQMPLFSCLAFIWDGIFIGATASVAIRDSMIWAVAAFYIVRLATRGPVGIQALYIAYFAHLIARDVYLSIRARKDVFSKVS